MVFQNGIFLAINRPIRVTKSSAAGTDDIPTNTIIDSHIQSVIIKTNISDHFDVSSSMKTNLKQTIIKKTIFKRDIKEI